MIQTDFIGACTGGTMMPSSSSMAFGLWIRSVGSHVLPDRGRLDDVGVGIDVACSHAPVSAR
jgi:hypothetical protein